MNDLVVKEVNFSGDSLLAAQNSKDGKIYVGVSWVCNGIGLTRKQKDRQVCNIQKDIVLKQGYLKFGVGVFDPNNETVAIDIEFLPLWLAKISITPKMKENNPETVEKLVQYQLEAKDVLAKAFLGDKMPNMINDYINMSDEDKAIAYFTKMKENRILGDTIKTQAPKVEKYEKFKENKGLMNMESVAKLINEELKPKKKIGRNTLFKILRKEKILQTKKYKNDNSHNVPYQKYIDKGYFEVKANDYKAIKNNGDVIDGINLTTYVTTEGLDFIYELLRSCQ